MHFNRIKGVKIAVWYAFNSEFFFKIETYCKKIFFLPAAIIARDVCSCLYLRSRDFGSMKDSGGVETSFTVGKFIASNA